MGLRCILVAAALALTACSSNAGAPAAGDAGVEGGGGGSACTAARKQLLAPVAKSATAEVKVVRDDQEVVTVYVDASAGGFDQARRNPRVYITLLGTRVDVTDEEAPASTAWDLALKRQVVFTNGGDAGAGLGGAVLVEKAFEDITIADAPTIPAEKLFDAECNPVTDEIQDPRTSFTGWYDYDPATMRASARAGVSFLVRSAAGVDTYAVRIRSYTARPDGTTTAPATGFYLLDIRKL